MRTTHLWARPLGNSVHHMQCDKQHLPTLSMQTELQVRYRALSVGILERTRVSVAVPSAPISHTSSFSSLRIVFPFRPDAEQSTGIVLLIMIAKV